MERPGQLQSIAFFFLVQIPRNHCCIFDPLFNEIEISVLNTLGLTVLSENEVRF